MSQRHLCKAEPTVSRPVGAITPVGRGGEEGEAIGEMVLCSGLFAAMEEDEAEAEAEDEAEGGAADANTTANPAAATEGAMACD